MTHRRPRCRTLAMLGVLSLSLIVIGCRDATKGPTVAKQLALPDSADQLVFGVRMVLTDRSVAKGLLLADTLFTYSDGTRLELRQVHFTFYTSQGFPDGTMTSRAGTFNTQLNRLEARGNVLVLRNDGQRLETQQLVYDQARNQIFSDSAFTMTKPNKEVLAGIGFESDPQMSNFRVHAGLKGVAPMRIPRK